MIIIIFYTNIHLPFTCTMRHYEVYQSIVQWVKYITYMKIVLSYFIKLYNKGCMLIG